jgi:hypothetical protein
MTETTVQKTDFHHDKQLLTVYHNCFAINFIRLLKYETKYMVNLASENIIMLRTLIIIIIKSKPVDK